MFHLTVLSTVDGHTGTVVWSFETGMMIWSCGCLMYEDKYIAFGSLDTVSGTVKWNMVIPWSPLRSPQRGRKYGV